MDKIKCSLLPRKTKKRLKTALLKSIKNSGWKSKDLKIVNVSRSAYKYKGHLIEYKGYFIASYTLG